MGTSVKSLVTLTLTNANSKHRSFHANKKITILTGDLFDLIPMPSDEWFSWIYEGFSSQVNRTHSLMQSRTVGPWRTLNPDYLTLLLVTIVKWRVLEPEADRGACPFLLRIARQIFSSRATVGGICRFIGWKERNWKSCWIDGRQRVYRRLMNCYFCYEEK